MGKLRLGLLFGGRSVEHEVSIASATSILSALDSKRYEISLIGVDKQGRWLLAPASVGPAAVLAGATGQIADASAASEVIPTISSEGATLLPAAEGSGGRIESDLDVIFPIIHGSGGEDGSLQGLLELTGIAYVGSGVLSSAVQMDKDFAKRLLQADGLPVVPWHTLRSDDLTVERIPVAIRPALERLGLPVYVKPANSGSSVGISLVERESELADAVAEASRYDTKVLIEKAVDAREIEVAVLGNESVQASLPGEIRAHARFYDYEAKYRDQGTELIIPAELSESQTDEIRKLAVRAYRALGAEGLARVDFLLDRESGTLYINEMNSLPGFTDASMYPLMWEATGLSYTALLDRLIELALERHQRVSRLERNFPGGGKSEGN
jgi:D-alanine-D-alanine ligase